MFSCLILKVKQKADTQWLKAIILENKVMTEKKKKKNPNSLVRH